MKYVTIDKPIARIIVDGAMLVTTSFVIKDEISTALNTHGCTQIEVDCSKTTYIDSASGNALVQFERMVGIGNLWMKNANEDVIAYLKTNRLLHWVK